MTRLTKKQKQLLDYIRSFQDENGYSPSYREIAKHFKLSSPATVSQHIRNLEDSGFLNVTASEARSLELTQEAISETQPNYERIPELASDMIPLAGLITAGLPIEAVEEKEMFHIPSFVRKGQADVFALRVKGDSMIEDGIFDGDYVIIKRQNTAQDGDIVVALIDNEYATLKRYYREKDHIRLQPANASMEPFRIKGRLKIQGKLTGLIRRY